MRRILLIRILLNSYSQKKSRMDDQDAKADTQRKVILSGPTDTGRRLIPTRKEPITPWQVNIAIIPQSFPKGT